MNVASLELCKELYELSGWEETRDSYYRQGHYFSGNTEYQPGEPYLSADNSKYELAFPTEFVSPAYSLGYLLRKLQNDQFDVHVIAWKTNDYSAACYENGEVSFDYPDADADTPEDAACKLAIELFKQGILTREEKAL